MRTETEALLGKLQLAGAQRAETHTKVLHLLRAVLAVLAHCSPLTAHYSLPTTHYYSLITTHCSLLTTHDSLLLLPTRLTTHYLQVLSHWEGELHAFVQAGVGARLELVQMEGNARIFEDMKELLGRQKQAGALEAATLCDRGCNPM